jgi:prevent-host-death family protein
MVTMVTKAGPMRTIKASEFKAKCLKLMDDVNATGEEIVVTKSGEPVARLVAVPKTGGRFLFGAGKGLLEIAGDLTGRPSIPWDFDRWPKEPPKPASMRTAKTGGGAKAKHAAAR